MWRGNRETQGAFGHAVLGRRMEHVRGLRERERERERLGRGAPFVRHSHGVHTMSAASTRSWSPSAAMVGGSFRAATPAHNSSDRDSEPNMVAGFGLLALCLGDGKLQLRAPEPRIGQRASNFQFVRLSKATLLPTVQMKDE